MWKRLTRIRVDPEGYGCNLESRVSLISREESVRSFEAPLGRTAAVPVFVRLDHEGILR